tara:strand:+ start:364 stop:486 length:123 start_codon:yes stop_codon:yes gene_type:complete
MLNEKIRTIINVANNLFDLIPQVIATNTKGNHKSALSGEY